VNATRPIRLTVSFRTIIVGTNFVAVSCGPSGRARSHRLGDAPITQIDDSLDAWFIREILVHEESLVRYLCHAWSNRHELQDLRQDTYVRVYEAAAKSRPLAPKSFLFATARHLIVDRIRRRRVVAIDGVEDLDALGTMVEELSPEHCASAYEELRRLARAFDQLPPKCRETVWLRRVDGLSQQEVASSLGVTQKTVEKHVMRGMKLLADALSAGPRDDEGDQRTTSDRDAESRPGLGRKTGGGVSATAKDAAAHKMPAATKIGP
jgi:RNA polymerase sigma factor (sigma-70 family)